jgi:hypothetical protein
LLDSSLAFAHGWVVIGLTTKEERMAQRTKADRQAAAQKAAATRRRNQVREESETAGKKAASTRQANDAVDDARQAKSSLDSAVSGLRSVVESATGAVINAGKSAAGRAGTAARVKR